MKKLLIIAAIIGLTMIISRSFAQTKLVQAPEQPIWVKMLPSQLNSFQQVLGFAFQNLPTSQATGTDITAAQNAIKALYPVLVADSTVNKQPVIKK